MSNPEQFPNCLMLTAPDMKASIAFYVEVCGFELKESWPEGDHPQWANLNLNGQSVMVGCPMEPAQVEGMCAEEPKELEWHMAAAKEFQSNTPGVGAYFYLMVEDVDAFHAAVIARGGKPVTDPKTGDMYCGYCTDGTGKLKPYSEVLEGTIQGYFMGMQKMERSAAEVAAKEMLAKMPAWNPETCA